MLWGMINVMQVIVHMPLLNVQFPENASYFFSLIIQISSFDIIPSSFIEWVKSKVFSFTRDEPTDSFVKMGYQSKRSVENLDSMFIYLGGLIGLVIFVIAIRIFKEKS